MFDDEKGRDLTDKELMHIAGQHLSEACAFLFECESDAGRIMAVQADLMLKLIHILKYDEDLLIAATSYDQFESEKYAEFLKKRNIKLKTVDGEEVKNE